MAYQKLQVARALRVIPSNNSNIPFPAVSASGTNTSTSSNKLINSGATFVSSGVKEGDIVYNTTDSTTTTVLAVNSETMLTLSNNIFTSTSKAYIVYDGLSNDGCVLYVGGAGDIAVVTAGGDSIIFNALAAGNFVPVHVVKVLSTGTSATLINALW